MFDYLNTLLSNYQLTSLNAIVTPTGSPERLNTRVEHLSTLAECPTIKIFTAIF